jgi:putative colanic acid biosynthesis UDP-glucose lipid carrier transferase
VPEAKSDLQVAFLNMLRVALGPILAVGGLVAATVAFGVDFEGPYVALAIIAALLLLLMTPREMPPLAGVVGADGLALAGRIGLAWFVVVAGLLLLGYATKTSEEFSRRALFAWFVATPAILVLAQLGIQRWLRRLLISSRNTRRAVIVGSTQMALELARVLASRPELGLRLHGVFLDERSGDLPLDAKAEALLRSAGAVDLPADGSVRDYVNARRIDAVFVARHTTSPGTQALLAELRDTTSSVYLIPDVSLYDLIQARVANIDTVPIIALCESPLHGTRGLSKRITDVVIASALLVAAAPVMLLIAVAIRLDSPGRILFRQDRHGLGGERIVVYKFRTMTVEENGPHIRQATRDDPRVTRVGRFLRRTSLDELPQLINVLQGRMSLVGPRPHAVAHNDEYRKLISGYMVRHKVAPGITGLAQVSGYRGETSTLDDMRRRVQYDLEYLRHWCWLLDMKILLRTLVLVIRDKRAY